MGIISREVWKFKGKETKNGICKIVGIGDCDLRRM